MGRVPESELYFKSLRTQEVSERVKAVWAERRRGREHMRAQAACAYTLVPLKLPSQSVGSAEQIVAVSATGSSSRIKTSVDH